MRKKNLEKLQHFDSLKLAQWPVWIVWVVWQMVKKNLPRTPQAWQPNPRTSLQKLTLEDSWIGIPSLARVAGNVSRSSARNAWWPRAPRRCGVKAPRRGTSCSWEKLNCPKDPKGWGGKMCDQWSLFRHQRHLEGLIYIYIYEMDNIYIYI